MAGTKVKVKVTQGKSTVSPHGTNFYYYYYTHTHTVLVTIFLGEPGLAGCPLIFLMRGSDLKFYCPDALPGTNQQQHTGLHLYCIHFWAFILFFFQKITMEIFLIHY